MSASPAPEPTPTPPPAICPVSGAAVTVGPVDAALGHRAVVLTLRNCGSGTLTINGYPQVAVLDAARKKVKLTVQHGSSYLARDPGPQRIRLAKGETLLSVVAWSNTVTDGDTTNGSYLAVAPAKGEPTVIWPVFTDLGTTGKVELTAWCTKQPGCQAVSCG